MALLFELADYSLRGKKRVPEEKPCTSKARQLGITKSCISDVNYHKKASRETRNQQYPL